MGKKPLVLVAILLLVAAAAFALFVATFDIDRFRPQIVAQLEGALGHPVTLARLSLGWQNGLAVRCEGLVISEGLEAAQKPLLQVAEASAQVALLPLLRKSIQVSSVLLREPTIHIARDAQGRINLAGLAAAGGPALPPSSPAQAPAARAASSGPSGGQVDLRIGTLHLINGTVHWTDASMRPPMELWVRALDVRVRNIVPGRPLDFDLRAAVAAEAPNTQVSGRLVLPGQGAAGSIDPLELSIESLPIHEVLPKAGAQDPQVRGELTVRARGSLPTLDPAGAANAASLQGTVAFSGGTILNVNVLRAVFERFSMLPGLMEALMAKLPAHHQELFARNETWLAPFTLPFTVVAGRVQVPELAFKSDAFGLSGTGEAGFDGSLRIQGALQVERELSLAIVRSVKELGALANAEGELEMPLVIQGKAPHVVPQPDLNYIASRVGAAVVTDLLGRVLGGISEPNEATAAEPAAAQPGSGEAPAPDDALGELLGRILAPQQAPSTGAAQGQ